jgi:glycosyltransferase involved in cell wall biosynthesis
MSLAGLHIGLVGPLPPPAGGMANQTRQLAELLSAAGAQVSLVQTNAAYRPAWAGRVPVLRALFRLLPYVAALWRAAGRAQVMHVMANSGWSWHLFAAPAIWVARWRRVPVVVNYRGGEAAGFLAKSGRSVAWSLRRAARLIVPSGFLQQVFGQHGLQAHIVPNVVDLQRFQPLPAGTVKPPHLLVARNLEPIYDNATALRAFAQVVQQVPAARLTVAGTGPELAALQALAHTLGVAGQVEFAGRLDRDTMAQRLRHCAVALNPSRVDNTPNSVLEALASGVPVVSTLVGGVPFLVQHEHTALLVPPGDPQAMAQQVLRLLHDPALATRLAANGLSEVQRYTWPEVAPGLGEVYRLAMAGGRG